MLLQVFEGLVVGGEEAQMLVLRELHYTWQSHQQMLVVLVDKFLRTQVVQCATIANWIFSKEMTADFTKLVYDDIADMFVLLMTIAAYLFFCC